MREFMRFTEDRKRFSETRDLKPSRHEHEWYSLEAEILIFTELNWNSFGGPVIYLPWIFCGFAGTKRVSCPSLSRDPTVPTYRQRLSTKGSSNSAILIEKIVMEYLRKQEARKQGSRDHSPLNGAYRAAEKRGTARHFSNHGPLNSPRSNADLD